MVRHLKRLSMPKTWPLARKASVWITRPFPSGHELKFCLPINIILRDLLKITTSTRETKKLLATNEIKIDTRRVRDYKEAMGLFDRLYLPGLDKYYTLIITKKGKLKIIELPKEIAKLKPLKIKNKVMIKKARIQLSFHDGRTILAGNEFKVNDSLLFNLENKKIAKHLPLKKDAWVYVIAGKHVGAIGKFSEAIMKGNKRYATVNLDGKNVEILIKNIFVIDEENKKLLEENV